MSTIEYRNVGVSYQSYRIPTLKEWAIRTIRRTRPRQEFSALREVTFDVHAGESLGIIGGNGAGKSTLLRIAAGIVTPTIGECVTRGRLAPLIELGTGFDIELSARENILFNGALIGRSRADMLRKTPEIIEFAGLADFIDAPLRTYSTGMVARLAFAIATTVEADIVLLDEILSVGDLSFREKCEERIRSFARNGATMVFVSHDLPAVEELCRRVLWIERGVIQALGPAHEVVQTYYKTMHTNAGPAAAPATAAG